MKPLRKTTLMLLLCLTTAATQAQGTSTQLPKIFSNFPDEMPLTANTLRDAFSAREGEDVSLQLSSNFNFSGVVLGNEVKYSNLKTMIVKSQVFGGAIFQLSQVTNEDNSISYVGRIINNDAFDGFEIKKRNGMYHLQKFETKKILQDCNQ